MCKLGDIIVVKEFKDKNGIIIPRHSFVVIDENKNYIQGCPYDFVSNMMCSFHDEEHRKNKLKIESNLEIDKEQIVGRKINQKGGYIRGDELYYCKKKKIEYKVIAHMNEELLNKLVQLILKLYIKNKTKKIITNL